MRRMLFALSLLCFLSTAHAAVYVGADDSDQSDKDPYSFGELDGNGDGKIDQAEWKAGRSQLERGLKETRASIADALDRDHSGKVSRFEATEGKPRLSSLWVQTRALAMAANDRDGDGKLSDAERKVIVGRCTAVLARFDARIDANGNRKIEPSEAEKAITEVIDGKRKLFSICDRTNDGQLTQQEIDLAFDLLRAIAGD